MPRVKTSWRDQHLGPKANPAGHAEFLLHCRAVAAKHVVVRPANEFFDEPVARDRGVENDPGD